MAGDEGRQEYFVESCGGETRTSFGTSWSKILGLRYVFFCRARVEGGGAETSISVVREGSEGSPRASVVLGSLPVPGAFDI